MSGSAAPQVRDAKARRAAVTHTLLVVGDQAGPRDAGPRDESRGTEDRLPPGYVEWVGESVSQPRCRHPDTWRPSRSTPRQKSHDQGRTPQIVTTGPRVVTAGPRTAPESSAAATSTLARSADVPGSGWTPHQAQTSPCITCARPVQKRRRSCGQRGDNVLNYPAVPRARGLPPGLT